MSKPSSQTALHRLLLAVGGACARRPRRTVLGWLVAVVAVQALAAVAGGTLTDDMSVPGSSSERAAQRLAAHLPAVTGAEAHVVARGAVDDRVVDRVTQGLAHLPDVTSVRPVRSPDGGTLLLSVAYAEPLTALDAPAATAALRGAARPLADAGATVGVGGEVPESVQGPDGVAEAVGVAVALLILLLTLRSLLAAGLPLVVAGVGVGAGLGLVTLLARAVDLSTVSPTLGSLLGLGVGIDYALLIVTRHRRELTGGLAPVEAAARAVAGAGGAVVLAGGAVLLGLGGLGLAGIPGFATMGLAAALVVLATLLVALTLLPALLALCGDRLRPRRAATSEAAWAGRLATRVVRRPVPWLVTGVVVLLALAAPALGLRLGQNDAGSERAGTPTRVAHDLVADAFGPGANGPLVVVSSAAEAGRLAPWLARRPGVAAVAPAEVSADGTTAVLTVTPSSGPQDAATRELADRLRTDLPADVDLTGPTAAMLDLTEVLGDRLWLVVGAVLLTTYLLLVVVLRSVVVPLKAVVGNLLSVGASFGLVTLLFQTAVGASLIGLPHPVPVAAWAPVVLFAILFGLSMDYEIFLLSAVRERREAGEDDRAAVVAGTAGSARVITSAAAIMAAVAAGFAADPTVMVKIVGVGMAVAIVVDVTVVRLVLVPATMALLGPANWWLPGWLDRILPGPRRTGSISADRAREVAVTP